MCAIAEGDFCERSIYGDTKPFTKNLLLFVISASAHLLASKSPVNPLPMQDNWLTALIATFSAAMSPVMRLQEARPLADGKRAMRVE